MLLLIFGVIMLLGGLSCHVAEVVAGTSVFSFHGHSDMTSPLIETLCDLFISLLYSLLDGIRKNYLSFVWYGILLLYLGIYLIINRRKKSESSVIARFSMLCFQSFFLTGMTGMFFNYFSMLPSLTVERVHASFAGKLFIFPLDLVKPLQSVFVLYRYTLVIASVVSLALYALFRFCDAHCYDDCEQPILRIISLVAPIVYTCCIGGRIIKNYLKYANWWSIVRNHTFFTIESGMDFPFFRIIAVVLLCGILSFVFLRAWYRYRTLFDGNLLYLLLSFFVMLLPPTALVLLLTDMFALLLSSIISTIIFAVLLVIGWFALDGVVKIRRRYLLDVVRRLRIGDYVSSKEAAELLAAKDIFFEMDFAEETYIYQLAKKRALGE